MNTKKALQSLWKDTCTVTEYQEYRKPNGSTGFQENEELVRLIQLGVDIEKNMAELYQQNRNFIYKIALPYSKACDMDDLMQEAYFGLDKAVKGYDLNRNLCF